MSKMPAKKKSCFQITSVTQAQVAASSIADDTESLDDPRTEDVSSEIFDGSRTDLGVCDRSSSEETLNNGGEPHEGQQPAAGCVNGGMSNKNFVTGRVTPRNAGGSVPILTAINVVHTAIFSTIAPTSTSCSSRFRVIKLDHGSGEPFKRGKWTCTEFYERDSDSNVNRTVDRPVTLDHNLDRDSGFGTSSNLVVTSSAFSAHTVENTAVHPHPAEHQHQGYNLAPHLGNGSSAFQPTESTQQVQLNLHPVAPQNVLTKFLNGFHQGAMQQKSPIIPPDTQPQQYPYPTGSASQPEYCQQHFGASPQNLPSTTHPAVPQNSQVASSLINPAGSGVQGKGGEATQGHQAQGSNTAPIVPGSCQQQVRGNTPAPFTTTTISHSCVQIVPAIVPSSINTPPGVPSPSSSTRGLAQPQGAHGGSTRGLDAYFSNQTEDNEQKSDVPSQPRAIVLPGKDGIKPFIGESLSLATPAVNTLFGIHITMDVDEDRNPSTAFYQAFPPCRIREPVNDSASGASVVAIDNKIEQAMDLVKSHLMYAVREEVEVLKEQIKELYERNSMLERENAVLKSLANSEQLGHLSTQIIRVSNTSPPLLEGSPSVPHQPNITSA